MWTSENRGSYDRGKLRYPSDVTDGEWAHIAPLIPPAKRGGRKRSVDIREVVNGLIRDSPDGSSQSPIMVPRWASEREFGPGLSRQAMVRSRSG